MKTLILPFCQPMLPALLFAACAFKLDAAPIPGLFNTGVNEAGALLGTNQIDPHWTLVASADPSFPGPDAFTLLPGFPVGPWIAEGPNSRWIAPRANAGAGNSPGTYTYRTTFNLAGLDPTSAQITGRSSHDDSLAAIRLNGFSLGITAGGFGNFHHFTISAGSPFVAGENTLEFDVLNGGTTPNPTGFRCELSGTAVRADEPPSIAMQPASQTVIVGDTVTFTVGALGAPPLSYQWRFNNAPIPGAEEASYTIAGVTTNNAGSYSVTVVNFDGQTNSQAAVLTVLMPFPGIYNTGLDDNRMLLGDGAVDPHYKLVVNADNPGADALAQSGIPSPPWIPNSLKSRWIGPRAETTAAGGHYRYQLTLDLTGYDPATAFLAGSWATDDGSSLFFNGVDTGFRSASPSTFSQFRITNGFVAGPNVLEFRLVNGGVGTTGLRVENLIGTAETNGVAPSPPRILIQPRDLTAYITGSAALAVVAGGAQPLRYQWSKGGAPISGQTNALLVISSVMRGDAGDYSVRVSNALGSIDSETARLTVIPEQLGVFNTGVDERGAALPIGEADPHYVLITSPDAAYPGPITFATAGPIPPWFANDGDSQWIAPRPDGGANVVPGAYTYRLIFTIDIPGEEATAAISALVGTDDDNRGVFLNGNNVGFTSGTGFQSLTPLTIPAGSGFVLGINTLDFVPNNGGIEANPSGLRVDDIVLSGVTVPPRLSISFSGGNVRIAWPVSAGSFVLQATERLPGGWVDSLALVNIEGNENVAIITPDSSMRFYRLSE